MTIDPDPPPADSLPVPLPRPAAPAPAPSPDRRDGHDLVALALAGLRPNTKVAYVKDLNAFNRWANAGSHARDGAWPPLEGTLRKFLGLPPGGANAALLGWVSDMEAGGIAPATIRRRVAAVKRVVKGCRLMGLTELVPEVLAPKAEAYRDTAGPGMRGWKKILARAEADVEVARTKGQRLRARRNLAILLLLHDRGLRRSEAAALDLADYDQFRPAVAVVGKGHTSKEWLTISTRAAAAIQGWVELTFLLMGTHPGDAPLFLQLDNAAGSRGLRERRFSDWSINEMVKAIAGRAGLSRTCTAHALRHQAVTEVLDRTRGNVRDAQQFSRHADVRVLMRYDDRRADVGGELSELLGGEKRRR